MHVTVETNNTSNSILPAIFIICPVASELCTLLDYYRSTKILLNTSFSFTSFHYFLPAIIGSNLISICRKTCHSRFSTSACLSLAQHSLSSDMYQAVFCRVHSVAIVYEGVKDNNFWSSLKFSGELSGSSKLAPIYEILVSVSHLLLVDNILFLTWLTAKRLYRTLASYMLIVLMSICNCDMRNMRTVRAS